MQRMTAMIPRLKPKGTRYRRGKAPDPTALLEQYRSRLAAIAAERQPEIDALSRKFARQDAAVEAYCLRQGFVRDHGGAPKQSSPGPVDRRGPGLTSRRQIEGGHR
nr:hypothetical protein BDOA9_0206670 [Bradyrhizobium sp. DOA9]